MKFYNSLLATAFISIAFVSCKKSNTDMAEKSVDKYVNYVDSVKTVNVEKAANNWSEIQKDFEKYQDQALNSVKASGEDIFQDEIKNTAEAYKAFTEKVKNLNPNYISKLELQQSLLGENFTGNDMAFTWVNKDNILGVYQKFVNTVSENKDNYTREDWDEIKLMYEAIDSRKNTVENEGLTSSDNLKIAALKVKFGPMYTINRMGAKSQENSEAKSK